MVRYKASAVLSNVFHCEAGRQLDSAILSFPIGTEVSKGTAARKMRMDVIEHEPNSGSLDGSDSLFGIRGD